MCVWEKLCKRCGEVKDIDDMVHHYQCVLHLCKEYRAKEVAVSRRRKDPEIDLRISIKKNKETKICRSCHNEFPCTPSFFRVKEYKQSNRPKSYKYFNYICNECARNKTVVRNKNRRANPTYRNEDYQRCKQYLKDTGYSLHWYRTVRKHTVKTRIDIIDDDYCIKLLHESGVLVNEHTINLKRTLLKIKRLIKAHKTKS